VFLPHLDEISPLKAIAGIPLDVPVLILAGGGDHLARPDEARALHEKVASHGRLVFFPGAGHGDLLRARPELYARTVLEFCRSVSPVGGRDRVSGISRPAAAPSSALRAPSPQRGEGDGEHLLPRG
jgi:hypothetical protein